MDIVLFGELDGSFEGYLPLVFNIRFVSNQIYAHIFWSVLLYLFEPFYEVGKSLITRAIVSQEYTVSSSVEDPGHRPEALLTCGVPYLQFDDGIVDL